MATANPENSTSDRRDPITEGSSLSGSKLRDNLATEKAIRPAAPGPDEDAETVDQDPGERQKENQNQSEDDPLAA
jgi:hypothetical protein